MPSFFVNVSKIFTAMLIVMSLGNLSYGSSSCVDLFTPARPSVFDRPISTDPHQAVNLIISIFIKDQKGATDTKRSAARLRTEISNLSAENRKMRAREIEVAIQNVQRANLFVSTIIDQMWMLHFAMDPQNAIAKLKSQIFKQDFKIEKLRPMGQFIRAFDEGLARQLTVELIREFAHARKTEPFPIWFLWEPPKQKDPMDLQPKRSISFLIKVLMGYPELLKSEVTPTNGIRYATFEKYILSVASLFRDANVKFVPPNAAQIGTMIGVVQKYLKVWSEANPDQNASIIIKGSFVNGLAVGYKIDVDFVIANPTLFSDFWNDHIKLVEDQIEKSLVGIGPSLPSILIDPGSPNPKTRSFINNEDAKGNGYLNTVSFEVHVDRVDILVHDHERIHPGHLGFESFRTE